MKMPDVRNQRPGATAWGFASTSDQLFICGESAIGGNHDVYHYSFDAGTGQRNYSFDDTRNGEDLVISTTGRSKYVGNFSFKAN